MIHKMIADEMRYAERETRRVAADERDPRRVLPATVVRSDEYRRLETLAGQARRDAHRWGQLAKVLLDFDGTLNAVLNDRAFLKFDKSQKALIRRVRQDLAGRIHAACAEQDEQEKLRDKLYREMEEVK